MDWKLIDAAPDNMGEQVIVFWRNAEGDMQLAFDYTEDGVWMEWHDHAENVHMIGGHGVIDTPPYTHWVKVTTPTGS